MVWIHVVFPAFWQLDGEERLLGFTESLTGSCAVQNDLPRELSKAASRPELRRLFASGCTAYANVAATRMLIRS